MGIECGECEHDLRGGHDSKCSRANRTEAGGAPDLPFLSFEGAAEWYAKADATEPDGFELIFMNVDTREVFHAGRFDWHTRPNAVRLPDGRVAIMSYEPGRDSPNCVQIEEALTARVVCRLPKRGASAGDDIPAELKALGLGPKTTEQNLLVSARRRKEYKCPACAYEWRGHPRTETKRDAPEPVASVDAAESTEDILPPASEIHRAWYMSAARDELTARAAKQLIDGGIGMAQARACRATIARRIGPAVDAKNAEIATLRADGDRMRRERDAIVASIGTALVAAIRSTGLLIARPNGGRTIAVVSEDGPALISYGPRPEPAWRVDVANELPRACEALARLLALPPGHDPGRALAALRGVSAESATDPTERLRALCRAVRDGSARAEDVRELAELTAASKCVHDAMPSEFAAPNSSGEPT